MAKLGLQLFIVLNLVSLSHVLALTHVFAEPPSNEYNVYEQMNHRGIWDGRYTNAKSGLGWTIPDAGSSEDKRGTSESPMKFYYPTFEQLNRKTNEVDRDELIGNFKVHDYVDAAVIQLPHSLKAYGFPIAKGYYQVYLGDHYSGSEQVNLGQYQASMPANVAKDRKKGKIKEFTAIIFKQQGRVMATAPISQWQAYKPQKGQAKAKERPIAILVDAHTKPKLEVYFKKRVYIIELTPNPTETMTSPTSPLYPPAS